MAKVKLPRGIRENKGTYEARAMVNGVKICLYSSDLDQLKEEFEQAKQQARNNLDYKRTQMTLNEWFEEWFTDVKTHKVKETSISPMRNNFKRTFGFYIGTMKIKNIRPMDVQQAINAMEKDGMSNSAMREALGRLRECMEFAVGSQLIPTNPCLIVEVPWTYKKSKEEIALTQEEQNALLDEVEDSWYKEMFYFMCLTGVRVGDADGKISLNQQKPSNHAGLRRFGPEKFLQRNNEFMKERPIFYKNPIKIEKDFSTWLRCFYYTTKAVITEYINF